MLKSGNHKFKKKIMLRFLPWFRSFQLLKYFNYKFVVLFFFCLHGSACMGLDRVLNRPPNIL